MSTPVFAAGNGGGASVWWAWAGFVAMYLSAAAAWLGPPSDRNG